MRILYVATVVKTHIMEFHVPILRSLKDEGWETAVAAKNDYEDKSECNIPFCDEYYDIPFARSPFSLKNIKAYIRLKKIIASGNFDIVHCHTPVGGVLARLACRPFRKKGLKVIYTAHGFHFYKGAPLLNWIMYYPVEWLCAHWTDVLITINKEDYDIAKKKIKAKRVEYIPGVGIDTKKYAPNILSEEEKSALKEKLGVNHGDRIFLSVGELSKRKNHETVLAALSKWDAAEYKYFIAGKGELATILEKKISEYGLEEKVKLLGYRNDISALCAVSDLFIFPSLQEGLPVALMEATASKIPVICSKIRGNEELVSEENLFSATSPDEVRNRLDAYMDGKLQNSVELNYNNLNQFDLEIVKQSMKCLYEAIGKIYR